MRRIDLNFASTPFRNNTPYYLGYGLGALLIAAFSAYNGYALLTFSKGRATLESDYEQKRQRLESLYEQSGRLQEKIGKQDTATLNERVAFTNKMLDNRRFSWTTLLNNLEKVQPYRVRLLSLRPMIGQKSITIEARAAARDLKDFWTLQQNLMNDVHFRRVYPAGFLKGTELGEVVFNIGFNYFPDGSPVDMEAQSPEEVARQTIVDAPGAGARETAEDPLPEVDIDEAPPATERGGGAKKPAPPGSASPPPAVKTQAPPPAPPDLYGRGAAPPPAQPPPQPDAGAAAVQGGIAASATSGIKAQATLPRTGVPAKLRQQGPGLAPRAEPPRPQKPKSVPMVPAEEDDATENGDQDDSSNGDDR